MKGDVATRLPPRFVLFAAILAAGCDDPAETTRIPSLEEPEIASGWRQFVVLEARDDFPAVAAVLPETLRPSAEAGIENSSATFIGTGMSIRFDYGARGHPGCSGDPCRFYGATVGGLSAQATVSSLPDEEAPLRTVHDYFVPLAMPTDPRLADPLAGSGLAITVKCGHPRFCGSADELVRLVRFRRQ